MNTTRRSDSIDHVYALCVVGSALFALLAGLAAFGIITHGGLRVVLAVGFALTAAAFTFRRDMVPDRLRQADGVWYAVFYVQVFMFWFILGAVPAGIVWLIRLVVHSA